MDSKAKHGTALIVCHFIIALVMLLLTVHFVSTPKDKLLSNKFVSITLIMAASIISSSQGCAVVLLWIVHPYFFRNSRFAAVSSNSSSR
jgi:predicted ferric reductase